MRILLADGDRATREGMATSLEQWGYEVILALDGHAAARALQGSDAPPLAFLGGGLPGRPVAEICRGVRDMGSGAHLVFLAAREDDVTLRAVLEAGADDFVYRPFDEHELKTRLRAARRILDLQKAARDAQAAFRYEAQHDQLTAALNRAAILDTLRHELDRASREHSPVGVVVLDVDGFRAVNEKHGSQGGDAVLREVMRRVSALARTYDAVGRSGTSEFLLVLPGCNAAHAAAFGERIRTALGASPFQLPDETVEVTASVGAAASTEGLTAEALVTAAVAAAEAASTSGGNAVRRAAEVS